MSVIERCHFVAYSFVFPALSSLSAMRCIVAARRPHSSTPALQNTNNQEDPSIPWFCLVDPCVPTLSLFDPARSLAPLSLSLSLFYSSSTTKQAASIELPERRSLFIIRHYSDSHQWFVRRFASRLSVVPLPIRESHAGS